MDRRNFITLSGLSLAAGCSGGGAGPAASGAAAQSKPKAGERAYAPVAQRSPGGQLVIHDRSTFIEQYKYENFKPGQDWKDDCPVLCELSGLWAQCTTPIQRRPAQVLEGLWLLGPDDYHQSIYLWDTGAGLLLIDPSYTRFQPIVETQIRQLGYGLDDVKWVLLTHMHFDHTESAAAWERRGAPVWINADEADYVTGRKKAQAADIAEPVVKPVTFGDGAELVFGNLKMKVIQTPGHTPGSSCLSLVWQDKKVLVSGDIVLHWGRHAWMGGDYCNWDQYLAGLWKLYNHPDAQGWQVMLPGHGTLDLEGAGISLYATLQVVSEIIRQRRAGSKIEWLDPYELFWRRKNEGLGPIEPLKS
jgi:hydroxyacylglutathione hydrolase